MNPFDFSDMSDKCIKNRIAWMKRAATNLRDEIEALEEEQDRRNRVSIEDIKAGNVFQNPYNSNTFVVVVQLHEDRFITINRHNQEFVTLKHWSISSAKEIGSSINEKVRKGFTAQELADHFNQHGYKLAGTASLNFHFNC